jgi:hypothetical protein
MTPTRAPTLTVVAVVCAVISWLAIRATFSSLPPLPYTALPPLLILGIGEAWSGRNLKARLTGRRAGKPLAPIAVARMVALAKASSLAAAAFGGLAAGFLIYVAGSLNKTVPRGDAYAAGATLGASVVLLAAALYLEHCCRAPKPPGDDGPDGSPNGRATYGFRDHFHAASQRTGPAGGRAGRARP